MEPNEHGNNSNVNTEIKGGTKRGLGALSGAFHDNNNNSNNKNSSNNEDTELTIGDILNRFNEINNEDISEMEPPPKKKRRIDQSQQIVNLNSKSNTHDDNGECNENENYDLITNKMSVTIWMKNLVALY